MKRIALITLIFCCLATVSSQVSGQIGKPRKEFAIGGNIGAVTSNVSFSPKIRQQFYLGSTFGATARYTSEKYFFLVCGAQVEANFVERGWKELIEDGTGNEYCRRMTYVEIPFFAHLGIGREARGVQGFLNIGPQIGFLLNDKEEYGGQEPWDISHRPNNITVQYGKELERKFEYGICGGVGMEIKSGIGNFSIEGRYYFGLHDIFGNGKKDFFGRSASTTIYAKITYMINITR